MTGYALKDTLTGKILCHTFDKEEGVVDAAWQTMFSNDTLQVVRVRVTEIKPRIKPKKRKASK